MFGGSFGGAGGQGTHFEFKMGGAPDMGGMPGMGGMGGMPGMGGRGGGMGGHGRGGRGGPPLYAGSDVVELDEVRRYA